MHTLAFLDYLVLFAIGLGLLLSMVIYHIPDQHARANRVLVAILVIATIFLTGKIFTPRLLGSWAIRLALLVDTAIFIIGPLIFLYVKRMLTDTREIHHLKPADYLLAFFHLMFFFWSLQFSVESFLKIMYTRYFFVFVLIEGMGIASLAFYLVKSIRTLRAMSRETSHLKIRKFDMNKFLKAFLGVLSMLCVIWMSSFIMLYVFRHPLSFDMYKGIWVSIFIFFYMVGFFSLKDPELLRKRRVSTNHGISGTQHFHLIEKELSKLMAGRIYEDPDLSLQGLSKELGTTAHNLSWFLNNVKQKSFNEYINAFRIEAFKEKISSGKHHQKTLLGLAMEAGFKSKSTFNKAFKDHLSLTPRQYVKQAAGVSEVRKIVA